MSAEITYPLDESIEPPPPPVIEKDPKEPREPKEAKHSSKKEDGDETAKNRISPVLKQLRLSEDSSLKDIVDQFGTDGSFSIRITRKWPEMVIDATGKRVQVAGFLTKVDKAIDEEWLQEHYGGGTYEILFRKKDAKGKYEPNGSYSRTFQIAGEPNLLELPRAATPPVGAVIGETTPMVTKAIDLMERQLARAEERADRPTGRSADDPMVEIMREQLKEAREDRARLLERIEAMQEKIGRPPEPTREEKLKDTIFEKLIEGDSARLLALRTQFDSELRQAKEAALANEARLHDRYERDRQDQRNAHEREIANLKQSYETQIATMRSSYEVSLQAAKASYETQTTATKTGADNSKEILNAEIKRLERSNDDLRDEVKELRAKKDKTIIETVKELEVIKDALGLDDGGDKSTTEKVLEAITNPEAISAVGKMLGRDGQPPPQPAQAPEQRVARPRVVRDKETGKKFVVSADGKSMRPAVAPPIPGQPQLPHFDPEVITMVVGYLERSYIANTEPEIVAQSAKASVPDPVLMALRDIGGVDVFLSKVAKLPSSSPLSATQAGRNWVKKVGKALLGE